MTNRFTRIECIRDRDELSPVLIDTESSLLMVTKQGLIHYYSRQKEDVYSLLMTSSKNIFEEKEN